MRILVPGPCWHLILYFFLHWGYFKQKGIKFGAILASTFQKFIQELHLLGNLKSNISTKALKKNIFKARLALFNLNKMADLMQILVGNKPFFYKGHYY